MHGKDNRNRKKKQVVPPSQRDYRKEFQAAYAHEVFSSASCIACGDPRACWADVWQVKRKVLKAHGLDNGKDRIFLVRLCDSCAKGGKLDPLSIGGGGRRNSDRGEGGEMRGDPMSIETVLAGLAGHDVEPPGNDKPVNPWALRADELARWSLNHNVVRKDAYLEHYIDDEGKLQRRWIKQPLTLERIARHFRAATQEDVKRGDIISLAALALDSSGTSSFAVELTIDVDCHDAVNGNPAATRRAALAWYEAAKKLGFSPILENSSVNSYHLRIVFNQDVEAGKVRALGLWISRDWKEHGLARPPEVFPKTDTLDVPGSPGSYGTPIRLFGRCPKYEFWSAIYNCSEWLDDNESIEIILNASGDDPGLIPDDAIKHKKQLDQDRKLHHEDIDRENERPDVARVKEALSYYRNTNLHYDDWLNTGLSLNSWDDSTEVGLKLWVEWSKQSTKHIDGECEKRWNTFTPDCVNGRTIKSLFKAAVDNGWKPISRNAVYEAIDDPHRLGRIFLKRNARIVWHRDEFHLWENSAYRPFPDGEINRLIVKTAKQEFDRLNPIEVKAWEDRGRKDRRGRECDPPKVRKVGTHLIADISLIIGSETLLSGKVDPPAWLIDNPPFPATDVLPTLNALVHLPGFVEGKPGATIEPTPDFFCPYALNYGFDPNAPEPKEWLKFLNSVWPKADGSELALQQWMGYLLTPDKRQHKMCMLIGPPRSGRGTICRVIEKMIGPANVAHPKLSGLATLFGMECLIGKPVAIIGDARQSNRGDWALALENILGVTGDDGATIARKNKTDWTGNLPTRLMLISNELPRFPDQSGAIATRPLLLRFEESFLGREDKDLDAKLEAELPSILLWSIEGWKDLRHYGSFLQPMSGQDLIDQLRDLSSPVGAFVRERCEIKAGNKIARSELFQAWKGWCANRNRDPGSADAFGRSLRAACPRLGMTQSHDKQGEKYRAYEGIDILSQSSF